MKNNKMLKKVVCFVIALMMLMPSVPNMGIAEASTEPTASDIVLNKVALPVEGQKNTYEIELSVKGKNIITGKKVDVILVVDNSNSMHNTRDGNNSLATITKNAANAFIDGVLTTENNSSGNVRVSVVRYGTHANVYQYTNNNWSTRWKSSLTLTGDTVYTSDNAKAKAAVISATTKFDSNGSGGTNTEGGFLMSSKVAGVKRSDAESIVIFMTDGLPTFRYNSDENATSDSYGYLTSKKELNEAIEAAQALENGSKIYSVALLSAFASTSNEAKLAGNLLSKLPKKYDSSKNTDSIINYVNIYSRWISTNNYVETYYPIFSGDNASNKMQEIYSTIAGTVNAMAQGSVIDVIPKDFKLTAASKIALEATGVDVTENSNGTTTIIFPNVSASEAINNLQKFTVTVNNGVYGTGFTNEYATYNYTLNTIGGESGSLEFPKPIVAINPTAANDDGYSTYMNQNLTVTTLTNILLNDETLKLNEGGYNVSNLVVEASYVTTITTTQGGTVLLSEDGTFVYTSPSATFVGIDTFTYKNTATVTGEGFLAGNYVSDEATVTINILPINGAAYKVEHYLQNLDFRTFHLEETENLNNIIGNEVDAYDNYYTGYYLDTSVEDTVISGIVLEDGSLILKLFYKANPYNVYYNPNGGMGEMTDENNSYIYEEEVTALENEFTNDGYRFVGWGYEELYQVPMFAMQTVNEIIYLPGDTFDMPDTDVTLYALWELDTDVETLNYTVEYYKDGDAEPFDTKDLSVLALNPIVTEVSYENMPDGYHIDDELSTKLPFTVEVEANNVIKVYYLEDTDVEGYDYVVINWMYETGYNTNVYSLGHTKNEPGTIVKAISYYRGFYSESGYSYMGAYITDPVEEIITIGDTTSGAAITSTAIKTVVTLTYDKNSSGGGGGGGGGTTIIEDPVVPLAELEKLDHFAYVIGYVGGDVKPLNNITREEVAMIFYRLLTDESRNNLLSYTNPFADMENHEWSNIAISTLYNAGIIKGYPDGSFKPSEPITRAEFATIAAKFDKLELSSTSKFTDIFGHWAEKYINSSEIKGWIKGYTDSTFKPNQDITRAEAMTLINNVLGRAVPEENIHPDAMFWPDNTSNDWYYEAVMEATNSHDYIYEEDGDELWTGMKANKVWP